MFKRFALVGALLVNLVAVTLLLGGPRPVAAATTRTVCASSCDFTTIQAAITAATAGDTITVSAGTYQEQIVVNKNLTITGAGSGSTTIQTPATPVCTGPGTSAVIVEVNSGAGVTMSGFTIAGPPTTLNCSPEFYGVYVVGGAHLDLSASTIKDISLLLPAGQGGTAIRVGSSTPPQVGTATLTGLTITSYQKRGVYIDGAGSNATISNSTITGIGTASELAQNGVVVVGDATATINNNTISDNLCTISVNCGPNDQQAAGVNLTGAGGAVVTGNTIINNDMNVYAEVTGAASVSDNLLLASRYEGVIVGSGNVTVSNNNIEAAGAAPRGVQVVTYDPSSMNSQATLNNNRITGFVRGIQINDETTSDAFAPTANGTNNSLSGNSIGVDNQAGTAADFTSNWWGSMRGPQVASNPGGDGAPLVGNVQFSPWLLDGTDTSGARGFQPNGALGGIATRLAFATQPGNGQPGQPLSAQPVVRAEDDSGNLGVNFSGTVGLAFGANPGGATLGGTISMSAVNGVATFTDISVNQACNGYTLVASASGLTDATSNAFDIAATPVATLTLTTDGNGTGTVVRDPAGTTTGTTTFQYGTGAMVTLTAGPSGGSTFAGWRVDGTAAGQVNPLHLTLDGNHSVVATFNAGPVPTFTDVSPSNPASAAITQLVLQGVIKGYGDGTFGPDDPTLRAQMAAMIARAMGWDAENHGNTFTDQCDPANPTNCVDNDLWRNVGTLAFYNVARGFGDGTYGPRNEVAYAQAISFITRAMVAKGYWQNQSDNDPTVYPNVTDPTHRQDIATYVHYAGRLPGTDSTHQNLPNWDRACPRAWFALALTQAINSYFDH